MPLYSCCFVSITHSTKHYKPFDISNPYLVLLS